MYRLENHTTLVSLGKLVFEILSIFQKLRDLQRRPHRVVVGGEERIRAAILRAPGVSRDDGGNDARNKTLAPLSKPRKAPPDVY